MYELQSCVVEYHQADGTRHRMVGYLKTEADGTQVFVTKHGYDLAQRLDALTQSINDQHQR